MLKIDRIKELKILFIVALIFSVSFHVHAQTPKIDVTPAQSTLRILVDKIEKETSFTFIYNNSIDLSQKISLNLKQQSLETVLNAAFKGRAISYEIVGKQVILKQQTTQVKSKRQTISGIVVDAQSAPIIGATVALVRTNSGTITNQDGKFTLTAEINDQSTLSVTYVGYVSKTIKVNNQSNFKITLQEDTQTLDEVVVVGYGTQKKVNLTGAVSSISAKELNKRPVVSAANALQGLDPAVNMAMGTGSPESNYSINIRGAISINSGSPLILVDGVETSLKQVNPNDIESISVLKDASASAIYGAKASAGVILVTTKSGGSEDGKAKISYSGRFGWAKNTTSTDFITVGYDHVTLANRFYNSYRGVDMYIYPEANGELQKLLDRRNDATEQLERPWVEVGDDGRYYYYGNFDWYDYLYNRTRSQQEHNISITGGTKKFNYYVSGRYLRQNGIFKIFGDTYENYSLRAKMSAMVTSKLRYSNNINIDKSEMKYPGYFDYERTIWTLQSQLSPAFLPLNPDGSIVQYPNQLTSGSPMGQGMIGALTANKSWNSKATRYIIISNQLDYDITKNLKITGSYSYKMRDPMNRYRNNEIEYSRALGQFATYTAGAVQNNYTENRYSETTGNTDIYLTYNNTWDDKHSLTAVAGTQYIDYRYSSLQADQTDLSNDDLATFAVANGVITLKQNIYALRTLGYFARFNYDYNGKYLIEVSGRADGSSRFIKGSRWGFFPSFSAGWRMSEEKFFKPLSRVWNNMKVRFSMGSLGNQQVSGYYTYVNQITNDNEMNYTFDDTKKAIYSKVSAPTSSDLTWETVTTYNFGFDMSFLHNRLTLTSDFYIRDTKDMLTTSMTLPDVYGASTPKGNSANLRTKGYEFYIRWNDKFSLAGKPFNYGITATFGDYRTKITKFYNPDKSLSDLYEGMTLGEIWGYHVDGLFASDEEAAQYQATINDIAVNKRVYESKGTDENRLRAGDVRFADVDGNNIISAGAGTINNPGDKRIIGNSLPRYNYSFRVDLSWNNFDISAFFQGVGRQDWYPASGQSSYDFWGPYAFSATSFIHKDFEKNCWSEDNTGAYFPRQRGYQAYGGGALGEVNDRYLQNAAYLRFKNLTIGYTIPLLRKRIQQLRVAFSGENLCYWSPLKKYCKTVDPELAVATNTQVASSGVGYFYPRTFSINIDITF